MIKIALKAKIIDAVIYIESSPKEEDLYIDLFNGEYNEY
jgi:hypothetical protein